METESKREVYIDKLSNQLKKWDRELEELEEKGENRYEKLKANLKQKVESLKSRRDDLRSRLGRVGDKGEDAFQKVKKDSEELWADTKRGFEKMRKEWKK